MPSSLTPNIKAKNMETNQQEISEIIQPVTTLQITPDAVSHLAVAARWSKFLSIMGFIGAGFLVLLGLALSVFFATVGRELGNIGPASLISPGLLSMIYFVLAAIIIWPVIYLNNFSNYATRAVKSGNTEQLTKAVCNLKRLFLFMGITTIIILAVYLILIVAIVVAGSMLM